jgi:exosortase A-associated hydrolase 2
MEVPFFFDGDRCKLFGVLHEPEVTWSDQGDQNDTRRVGVLLCNPFAEEKVISHRILVNIARTLSNEGLFCLRFDYMGNGDSEGKFEESTVETMLSDIQTASELLRTRGRLDMMGILGVRLGGTLAMLVAPQSKDVDWLAVIEPIVDGKLFMAECLRSNLTLQMVAYKKILKDRKALVESLMAGEEVSIEGYQLTKTLYEQISAVNLLTLQPASKKGCLVIGLGKGVSQRSGESVLEKLCKKLQNEGSEVRFEQVEEVQFWLDQRVYKQHSAKIEEVIVNWLHKACLADEKYKEHEL